MTRPDFDLRVRTAVYRHFAGHGSAPAIADIAAAAGAAEGEIREAYALLYQNRMLVLMPDGESIRMAPPFSGIRTQHRVRANGREYFANCAWDAFGIPAALQAEADVVSRCEQTREPLQLRLAKDGPPATEGWLFHVAVPAAHWWRDIVYT